MTYEDFTTYTEIDPNSHIDKTSSRVTVTGIIRTESAYVYADKGAGHFGNFEHKIDLRITAIALGAECNFWGVFNAINDKLNIYTAGGKGFFLNVVRESDGYKFRLFEYVSYGNYQCDVYIGFSLDTTYYLTINRTGTTINCYIYSDSARTNLIDTLTLTGCQTTTFRYVYVAQSATAATDSAAISGYCENLDLQEAAPPAAVRAVLMDGLVVL